MRRASIRVIALAMAVSVVLPASAAAILFDGETAKGVRVELRVSPGGTPKRFEVAATRIRCKDGRVTHNRRRYRDFDRARPGHFADRFKQRIRDGGVVLRERTRYEGDAKNDGSWHGTYEVNIRVYRKGERIDTCKLTTSWTATRARR